MRRWTNHHWFRWWLVAWTAPNHYLKHCWNIANCEMASICLGLNVLRSQICFIMNGINVLTSSHCFSSCRIYINQEKQTQILINLHHSSTRVHQKLVTTHGKMLAFSHLVIIDYIHRIVKPRAHLSFKGLPRAFADPRTGHYCGRKYHSTSRC